LIKADITFLGHSTVLVEMGDARILTDPVLFDRVSMLCRAVSPLPERLYEDIDVAVISHLHLDHLDFRSLRLLGPDTKLVIPAGAEGLLRRKGFDNVVELPTGQSIDLGEGLTVTATPAHHSGFRPPLGPRAEAVGYLLDHESERVYFAGDTDLFPEMSAMESVDLALLPVWGWGPNLGSGHLNPSSACEALRLLKPRAAVPIHWGTLWPMGMGRVTPHRLTRPPIEFQRIAAETAPDVTVLLTAPGESVPIPR
jgi:L-ascorbate metabolism protein UlaG (beta-lactamase superfamily)